MNTITRANISNAVYRDVGLSYQESATLVDSVLDKISERLIGGEQVKLSCFGTFSVRHKKAHIGRNLKTGEEVIIQPRKVLLFHASRLLRKRINE
ncbi:MAG: integration host factor subunit alpha [Parvibaculales bacterium]